VYVNLNDACDQDEITYEVVANYCGKTETKTGVFRAADAARSGNGRLVLPTIQNDCTKQVKGSVKYEKPGTSPIAAARVPVRAVGTDGKVLAKGFTSKDGNYSLKFSNTASVNYRVEVEATYADPLYESPRASVADLTSEEPYVFKTKDEISASTTVAQKDIVITKADNSGAFNIVNTVRKALEWVRGARGVELDPIGLRWSPGVATPGDTSYFKAGQLFIQGKTSDPDEFDDSVIAHELMHYVASKLSRDSSLGGHHDGNFSGPRLAWSEGVATGMGQMAIGTSQYSDSMTGRTATTDIETGVMTGLSSTSVLQGTSDGTLEGDVSEFLVAMVLWDLSDPANEPHDKFNQTTGPLYGSLFDFVPNIGLLRNRGVMYADFVDFLDGFRCKSDPANPAKLDADMKLLLDERKFPYDYATKDIGCP
jgi:hypothetical protein